MPRIIQFAAAIGLMALTVTGCGPGVGFSAPEIDPPADLIPGYVPEGFELVSGFELQGGVARVGGAAEADGGRGPVGVGDAARGAPEQRPSDVSSRTPHLRSTRAASGTMPLDGLSRASG